MKNDAPDLTSVFIKAGGMALVVLHLIPLLLITTERPELALGSSLAILPVAVLVGLYAVIKEAPKRYDRSETGRLSRTETEAVSLGDNEMCHVCRTDEGSGIREQTIRDFAIRGNVITELGRSTEFYCDDHYVSPNDLDNDLDQQFDRELNEGLQEEMLEDK